jgi:hypothetical protein
MSEQRKPVLTGGCQCGAVRYALYAMPDNVGICHCRMCQKAAGGPFLAFAAVDARDFAWTRGAATLFRSSSAAERGFCARCGTPLWFRYLKRPDQVDVSVGSLDEPAKVTPRRAVGIEGRQPWFVSLVSLPEERTGATNPPEDLARIVNYQHPDHDTPPDWHPPRQSA